MPLGGGKTVKKIREGHAVGSARKKNKEIKQKKKKEGKDIPISNRLLRVSGIGMDEEI